jgi:hypothetical protein
VDEERTRLSAGRAVSGLGRLEEPDAKDLRGQAESIAREPFDLFLLMTERPERTDGEVELHGPHGPKGRE